VVAGDGHCVLDELTGSCGVTEESVGLARAAQRVALAAGDGQAVVPIQCRRQQWDGFGGAVQVDEGVGRVVGGGGEPVVVVQFDRDLTRALEEVECRLRFVVAQERQAERVGRERLVPAVVDLPLDCQRTLLELIECSQRLGRH
jgi:hypothetical protein